jgi:hypothetical protein
MLVLDKEHKCFEKGVKEAIYVCRENQTKDDRRGLVIIFAYAFAYEGSLPTGVRPLEMSWNFLLFSSVGIPGH